MPKDGLPSGSRNIHNRTHFANGVANPDEHGPTDDGMADVQLLDLGNCRHRRDVASGQPMPGVDGQP
jgi:hypothetical protein